MSHEWMLPCMVLIRKFYVFMKYVAISKKEINEDCARELYESTTAIGCHGVGGVFAMWLSHAYAYERNTH